jgi:hypothetical protein
VTTAAAAIDAIAVANHIRPTAFARALRELTEDRASEARAELEGVAESLTTDELRRDLVHALELLASALSDLGQWEDLLAVCDRGLALCDDTGAVPTAWRLRVCRSHALDQLGRGNEAVDDRVRANSEFDTLARRIHDPELRAWFNRQPLAARWLGRPAEQEHQS